MRQMDGLGALHVKSSPPSPNKVINRSFAATAASATDKLSIYRSIYPADEVIEKSESVIISET